MTDELEKVNAELAALQNSLTNKVSRLKLCETRLENRLFRIGPELVCDPAQEGLLEEKKDLRRIVQELNDRFDSTKYVSHRIFFLFLINKLLLTASVIC